MSNAQQKWYHVTKKKSASRGAKKNLRECIKHQIVSLVQHWGHNYSVKFNYFHKAITKSHLDPGSVWIKEIFIGFSARRNLTGASMQDVGEFGNRGGGARSGPATYSPSAGFPIFITYKYMQGHAATDFKMGSVMLGFMLMLMVCSGCDLSYAVI